MQKLCRFVKSNVVDINVVSTTLSKRIAMNTTELQSLLHLLDRKILDIENSKSKDKETVLTHSVLNFVRYLADRELSCGHFQYRGNQTTFSSQPVYPYTISTSSNTNVPSLPVTICQNCWQKSNGKQTHCVHALSSSLGEYDL